MISLGIDPSTRTGIAVVNDLMKIIHTEEIEFKKQVGFQRIQSIVAGVIAVRNEFKPDKIVIEDMFVGQAASAVTIIQIGSLLRYFLWQEDIVWTDVSPGTLKKFVTGSGAGKKEQMMMFVSKRWGFESPTNNIADAVGLAMVGLCISGKGDFNSFSKEAVSKLV
jgi:crossover junction endodeoxyribonuclease RuvC